MTYQVSSSRDLEQDIIDFTSKFSLFDLYDAKRERDGGNKTLLEQRLKMIKEEMTELEDGIAIGNELDIIDALVDLVYFAIGTSVLEGYDFNAHWAAVHEANMTKVPGVKPTRPDSEGVDMIKPPGWIGPDDTHEFLLAERQRRIKKAKNTEAARNAIAWRKAA